MTEANSINAATTGIVGNTGTAFTGTAVTQYNILVGGSTSSTLSNVAPSATSGVPVISQGASANPTFGTAVVAGGGTGAVTLTGVLTGNGTSAITASSVTQYAVLVGGASNAVGSIADVATGQVLVSGGISANPAFSATPTVTSITFGAGTALSNYAEGTFTPTVVGTSVAGTATYSNQVGQYTRIGRQVFFYIALAWSSGNGSGNLQINGLPFTVNSSSVAITTSIVYTNAVATSSYLYFLLTANATTGGMNFGLTTSGGTGTVAYAASAAALYITGSYFI
jgi:hypothetical protein